MMLVRPGMIIDEHYVLGLPIEADGRWAAYRAHPTDEALSVVVRFLSVPVAEGSATLAALEREARALCRTSHAGVAEVLDFGLVGDRFYLVTELVEGVTLAAALRSAQSAASAVRGMAQVLAALESLHRSGIVHGDLKSSSLVLAADGRVSICDLGIARLAAIAEGRSPAGWAAAEDLSAMGALAESWMQAGKPKPTPPKAALPPAARVQARLEEDDDSNIFAAAPRRAAPRTDSLFELAVPPGANPLVPRYVSWVHGLFTPKAGAPLSPRESMQRTINLAITCAVSLLVVLVLIR